MPLLTVSEVRQHVETGLVDDALQRVLDGEEADIISRFGDTATATDIYREVFLRDLVLKRPATSITSITEQDDNSQVILEDDDYELLFGGRVLRRLYTGTNPRGVWPRIVSVVSVPEDQTALRRRVLVDLVKLAVQYNGVAEEWVGDYKSKSADYTRERELLMRQLAPRKNMVFA